MADPVPAQLAAEADALLASLPPERAWQRLTRGALTPAVPFAVHQQLYDRVFAAWDEARGPRPAWIPEEAAAARTHVGALMRERGLASYADLWRWSVAERAAFWGAAIDRLQIPFHRRPERVLDDAGGPEHPRWLPGAQLNVIDACFRAPDDRTAIVSGQPGAGLRRTSQGELRALTARVVAGLRASGLGPGDAVAIDMAMTPDAIAIYLGVVAAGMAVVGIADSMAAEEVGTRLRIAGPRAIFTAHALERGGKRLPLYEKVLAASPPRAIVLDARDAKLRAGDVRWEDWLAGAPAEPLAPVAADPDALTNVLFSSGTTGEPKAIPWTHLTPIKAAADAMFHLDVQPGDVVAWPTSLGWMMGPWLIYASLINGASIALFGDAPTGRPFGEFVAGAKVTMLGVVPSMVKAWRADDRMRGLDWSALRCFGSTGEASNATDYLYLMMLAGYRPVIEYCGGTEIGGGYLTGTLVQPASPATFTTPALGSDLVLLDDEGHATDNGEVFLIPPMLGSSQRLLNRDHHEVYYAGAPRGQKGELLRRHGDQMQRLPGGYLRALGRVDDTMNLGGIKVSSAEIERVLDGVAGVRRTAAIAIEPEGGGPSELVIYVVVEDASEPHAALLARLQQAVKARLNPLFRISDLVLVDTLPVTASNKIMRRELRKQHRRR
jgi:acetyl-CoA synthetase